MTNDRILVELREENESRPLDWRWQRAVILEESNSKVRGFDDKWINIARKFLHDLHRGMSPEKLIAKYPVVYEIHRIYNNTGHTRWTLEAMIMAGEPTEEICERFGWTSEKGQKIVEAYESLRYDIRNRLRFDSFILSSVLGQVSSGEFPAEEKIWKALAWVGGRRGVGTALLDGYMNIEIMEPETRSWYEDFIQNQFMRRTVRALLRFDPMRAPILNDIMKVHNDSQRLRLDQRRQGMNTVGSDLEETQKSLVDSLKLTTTKLEDSYEHSIEPRTMELLTGSDKNPDSIQKKADITKILEAQVVAEQKESSERAKKIEAAKNDKGQ